MLLQVFGALTIALSVMVGLILLLNNNQSKLNRAMTVVCFCSSAWVLSNTLSATTSGGVITDVSTSLITPTSLFSAWSFVLFASVFPRGVSQQAKITPKHFLVPVIALSSLAFSDLNVQITRSETGTTYELGPIYPYYVLLLLGLSVYGFYLLGATYRRSVSLERTQTKYLLLASGFSILPAIFTGVILPLLGNDSLWDYSSISFVLIWTFTTYTILRHKLFDVRLYAVRFLAYALTLGVLTGLYALLVLYVNNQVAGENDDYNQLINLVFIVVAVGLFNPLKRVFDALTSRLFYRSALDKNAMQSELNESLSAEVDISKISDISLRIITKYFAASSAALLVKDGLKGRPRIKRVGASKTKITTAKIKELEKSMGARSALNIDELYSSNPDHKHLRSLKASVACRISSHDLSGVLILGHRQDGSAYYPRDLQALQTACHTVSLALGNASKFEKQLRFNKRLRREVSSATADLKQLNQSLEQSNQAKSDLISTASHQLKPQVTASRGFIEMLQRHNDSQLDTEARQLLELAGEGLRRSQSIVVDMLGSSQIDSGGLVLNIATHPVDINDLVKTEVGLHDNHAKRKNIHFVILQSKQKPKLHIDELKLKEVLANYLSNALVYSPPNSTIEISIELIDACVDISVKDQGIGVGSKDSAKLFNKFFRSDKARKARPHGTGLGLYISKQIIKLHGGETYHKNNPSGQGSVFGLRLPID